MAVYIAMTVLIVLYVKLDFISIPQLSNVIFAPINLTGVSFVVQILSAFNVKMDII